MCFVQDCTKMRAFMTHANTCSITFSTYQSSNIQTPRNCKLCKRYAMLAHLHSRLCDRPVGHCRVPKCSSYKLMFPDQIPLSSSTSTGNNNTSSFNVPTISPTQQPAVQQNFLTSNGSTNMNDMMTNNNGMILSSPDLVMMNSSSDDLTEDSLSWQSLLEMDLISTPVTGTAALVNNNNSTGKSLSLRAASPYVNFYHNLNFGNKDSNTTATTTNNGNENLSQSQVLAELVHAGSCSTTGTCSNPRCVQFKKELTHARSCSAPLGCGHFKYCMSSRYLLLHYANCIDGKCELCHLARSGTLVL
jgi:hypothetical protein